MKMMNLFSFSAFIVMFLGTTVENGAGGLSCLFQISNTTRRDLTLSTNVAPGSRVSSFEVVEVMKRRLKKRGSGGLLSDDLVLETNSSQFHLEYEFYGKWYLVVTRCLTVQREKMGVTLSERLRPIEGCGDERVPMTIDVQLTKPDIVTPNNVNINASFCKAGLRIDVIQLRFRNAGDCVTFTCSVECMNVNKAFLIDTEMNIWTSVGDIDFQTTYKLQVGCTDVENTSSMNPNFVDVMEFEVNFTGSCPLLFPGALRSTTASLSPDSGVRQGVKLFSILLVLLFN